MVSVWLPALCVVLVFGLFSVKNKYSRLKYLDQSTSKSSKGKIGYTISLGMPSKLPNSDKCDVIFTNLQK